MTAIEQTLPEAGADVDVTAVVDEIREMNSDDWSTLQTDGSGPDVPVLLDFAFSAPDEDTARELADWLVETADYEADVASPQTETDDWAVRGTTSEVMVTESGLDEWVVRMAAAGTTHGCSFEGWGALLAN